MRDSVLSKRSLYKSFHTRVNSSSSISPNRSWISPLNDVTFVCGGFRNNFKIRKCHSPKTPGIPYTVFDSIRLEFETKRS